MFKYFLKRLAQMLVTLFIVSILVFVLANFIGDPVNMLVSPKAPPEVREQVREELGLNRPILEQYVSLVKRRASSTPSRLASSGEISPGTKDCRRW